MEACLQAEVLPKMMENLPATDSDAIDTSLEMVDRADIYIGIFAHRYGYIPEGNEHSITRMEYERAVEKGIPLLIFIVSEDVPVLPKDIDMGEVGAKLLAFKEELLRDHVVKFFESPENLKGPGVP